MKTPDPLRWGILGCARITRRGIIPGVNDSQSGVLHAISSRDGTTARAWADEFKIPRAYDSYEAVLADPEVQAIYVPLPNELHKPWVLAAADAGKHVLCEKPLALNSAEARAMVEHCRERNVILMEAFMWNHQPRTAGVLKLVRDGAIGHLRLIRSSFSFAIDMTDWRLDPARGGGALMDVGTYGVSTARLYAGSEPTRVEASAHLSPSGVDISLSALLTFPGNISALIDCSFEQPFRCSYELVGTKGSIEVLDAYLPPERPVVAVRDLKGNAIEHSFDGTNQYAMMVDAFARGVADGTLPAPAEDGLAQMQTLDAILASIKRG
ncbi:Gfo/Idh/MocA family oxidoreductase [Isosphaeraceae bacterium EP7]